MANNRQVVVDLGSWTLKVGLWEQSFLPSLELPACFQMQEGQRIFLDTFNDAVEVKRPISQSGGIVDAPGLEALLCQALRRLGIMEPWSDVLVLFCIPAAWSPATRIALCRIAMEGLGVGGIYLAEQPVLAAWATGTNTALVLDVGGSGVTVTAVIDGRSEVSEFIPREAMDMGKENITKEVASLMRCVVEQCQGEVEKRRPALWDSIVLTGLGTRDTTTWRPAAVEAACQPHLAISAYHGEHQADSLRFRSIPEYYHEVHQRALPLAAWFGGGIVAKTVFGEGARAYWTQSDWQQHRDHMLRLKPL